MKNQQVATDNGPYCVRHQVYHGAKASALLDCWHSVGIVQKPAIPPTETGDLTGKAAPIVRQDQSFSVVAALRACEKLLANSRMGGQNRPEQAAYDKVVTALAEAGQ